MNGYGSIQVSMQGKDVSAEVASCPEEMPQVVGVITSRTRARRGAGEWIEIGRKHRAFVPDGTSRAFGRRGGRVLGASDSQWRRSLSDGLQDTITTIRSLREPIGVAGGPRLASYPTTSGRGGMPIVGPPGGMAVLCRLESRGAQIVKGTLRSARAISADPFLLYRRRRLPFQAAVAAAQVLGHELCSDGHYKAAVMEVLARADEEGVGGISEAHLVARCAELIGLPADKVAPSITLQGDVWGNSSRACGFRQGCILRERKPWP
jgi:hypothetical protein